MAPRTNSNNTTSDLQTAIAVLKGNIGPGCLALPWAFSLLGIPLGCTITIIMTAMVTWNAWTLVALKRRIWDLDTRGITYSDVGEQIYGPQFRIVIDMSVITIQLAVCTIFLSNMSENISSTIRQTLHLDNHADGEESEIVLSYADYLSDKRLIMLLLLPPVLILSSIPNLKRLAPSITLAIFLMVASFLLIGSVIYKNWNEGLTVWLSHHQSVDDYLNDIDWKMVPIATCAIMYSLEGDQLILPIESSMAHPSGFGRVLVISMAIVGILFCIFASACVIAFGSVDGGSITAFLMDHRNDLVGAEQLDSADSTYQILLLTNVIVSLSLLFTYPLQLYPAIGLVGQIVSRRDGEASGSFTITVQNELVRTNDATHNNESNALLVDSSVRVTTENLVTDKIDNYAATENHRSEYNVLTQSEKGNGQIELGVDEEYSMNDQLANGYDTEDRIVMEGDSLRLRIGLVLTTFTVAIIIPHLKALISLAGAVTGSATSLILPPMLASKFLEQEEENMNASYCKHNATRRKTRLQMKIFYGALISIGWVYAIIGTISSIEDIISIYTNQSKHES